MQKKEKIPLIPEENSFIKSKKIAIYAKKDLVLMMTIRIS